MTRANLCATSEPCFLDLASAAPQQSRRVVVPVESTDCQKISLVYLLVVRDAQRSLDQRDERPKADVQIGGGVRVSDAFQAKLD